MNEKYHTDVKPWLVTSVLKQMGFSYRKIQKIPLKGNDERNLVLRMEWAEVFFSQPRGTIYVNIDQSWLGMSDFRRYKWAPKNTSNSVAKFSMAPRVTMIVAVCSTGEVWFSLV